MVLEAGRRLAACLRAGGKVLVFGNGGSAADAQHLAGELVGRYLVDRRALPAIALTTDPSIITAVANDLGYDAVFRRQVEAHGRPGRRGHRHQHLRPLAQRARRSRVGAGEPARHGGPDRQGGGRSTPSSDHLIDVPSTDTPRIQEVHGWSCTCCARSSRRS